MSAQKDRFMRERLDALFNGEIERGRLGGASIAVTRRGERIVTAHWGTDAPDTIYRIYSMTKPVSGLAAMILYERGQLDPDRTVAEYLPAYADMRILTRDGTIRPASRMMRISDLLNMTSGLVYPNAAGSPAERALARREYCLRERIEAGWKPTTPELMEAFAEAPLAFEPGTDFLYGMSADVFGAVLERICGEKADVFIAREILAPLGMTDTGFTLPPEKRGRLAPMYTRMPDAAVRVEPVLPDCLLYAPSTPERERSFVSCGAGLYSTIEDCVRLAECFLTGGGLLERSTLDFMRSNRLTQAMLPSFHNPGFTGCGYGNFLRILMDPVEQHTSARIGECGWDGLPGCYFRADPDEQLTTVYMQQILEGPDWGLRYRMQQIIYSAQESITDNR